MFRLYGNHCAVIHGVPNSRNEPEVSQYRDTEEEIRALAEEYARDGYDVTVYLNNSLRPSYELKGAAIA